MVASHIWFSLSQRTRPHARGKGTGNDSTVQCCRRHLSKLLVLDGRDKLEMWWVEEGYLTDLTSVLLVCLRLLLRYSQDQEAIVDMLVAMMVFPKYVSDHMSEGIPMWVSMHLRTFPQSTIWSTSATLRERT